MAARTIEIVFKAGKGPTSVAEMLLDGNPIAERDSGRSNNWSGPPFCDWDRRPDGSWVLKVCFVEADWED